MKKNILEIIISVPVKKVFEFTINPDNTSKWIESIIQEKTNEYPIKIGTIYKNLNKKGIWTEYEVINFKKNKLFELKQKNNYYFVRYDYKSMHKMMTKLIYTEWVVEGHIESPFTGAILNKLKKNIE